MTPPLRVVVHDARITHRPPRELEQSAYSGWATLETGAVLLHGDPVGIDPLAWRLLDRTLHLARYPAVLAEVSPAAPLDTATLRRIAQIQYPQGAGSCFASVGRVPAGCDITIEADGTVNSPRRWYQLPPERKATIPVDLWRALVHQCGSLQDRWGDAAVLLSGGLDSSAVAAAAAAAARERGTAPPLLLSVAYPGLGCDESAAQQSVAAHLRLPLVQVDATGLEMWPAARESIRGQGIPTADLQAAATGRLLETARREGKPLVLMGLGGDALFAGDGAELELYRRGRIFAAWRFFRDWGDAGGPPGRVIWYRRGFRRHLLGRPFGSPEEVKAAGSAHRAGLGRALNHPAHGWRTEMIERTISPPAPTIGCPLYGKEFLDAFARVRALDLTRGPGFKGLLRRIATPHLPSTVVERRRKANFDEFHRVWVAREREEMITRFRGLRGSIPEDFGLPPDIAPLFATPDFSAGLLSAWFALCLAEFVSR